MLKRDITYEDLDGTKVTDTFYFNMTKTEILAWEVEHEEGLDEWFKRIVRMEDRKALVGEFKSIILKAYGERADDNKRFVKSDELRERFAQTMAFDQLFFELATDDEAAATFLIGIMPAEVQAEAKRLEAEGALPRPNIRPAEEIRAEKEAAREASKVDVVELPQPTPTTEVPPPPSHPQPETGQLERPTRGW